MPTTDTMSQPDEDLQALVLRRLTELGDQGGTMSLREAAARSRGNVSYETLRAIGRGTHSGRLTDRIAQGLSFALDVPLTQVYDAANIPRPGRRWEWPERFDRLEPAQREIVEAVASGFLEAFDKGRRSADQ